MTEETISLRVSREELAALLDLLDTPSLPGMGEHFLEGLNEAEQAFTLAAGRRALVARGWMEDAGSEGEGRQVTVDPTLLALVGECTRATQLTIVSRHGEPPPPAVWYIHHGPNLRVIHRLVASGVHEFVGAIDPAQIQAAVLGLFPFAASNGHGLAVENEPAYHLAQDVLDAAIAQVRDEQTAAAAQMLQGAGMNSMAARAFAEALHDVEANSTVVHLDVERAAGGEAGFARGISLVESEAGVWIMRPSETGDATVLKVEQTTGPAFARWVERLLN